MGLAGLPKLKDAVSSNNSAAASELLGALKIEIATTPADQRMTPVALHDERAVYECAVLLSVQVNDTAEFERHMALLTPYYTDFGSMLEPSENHFPILGLNLLRLLAQNRIADFHTQLETITDDALTSPAVQFPVLLEQNMMEGSYTKVLEMKENLPRPDFSVFMEMLKDTLRGEVASVSEKAYKSLPVATCMQRLMMSSQDELAAFAAERGWTVVDQTVCFEGDANEKKEVPALETISEMLHYAKELERIV